MTQIESEWHPLETAPKDGQKIILANLYMEGGDLFLAYWDDGEWIDREGVIPEDDSYFTHWCPIPPLPEEGE